MPTRKLDRLPQFDTRSRAFGIAQVTTATPKNITWSPQLPPLDQGWEGACVGFGLTQEALSTPVRVDFSRIKATAPKTPDAFARWVYAEARKIDEFEGEEDTGTSVLAGLKIMVRAGLLKEYRWCFSPYQIALGLLTGPVVLGINWYESMYDAPGGIVDVNGAIAGGHCILCIGYRLPGVIFPDDEAFLLFNSWGDSYGDHGKAWISGKNMARLMREYGEAAVPFRRSYGR